MEHTQCLLVEKGHLATVANCQHPAEIIGGDTVDGAVECIRPDFMLRSILLGGLLSLEHRRYETESHQIAVTDMNGEYSSTGESADHRHWKRGIP